MFGVKRSGRPHRSRSAAPSNSNASSRSNDRPTERRALDFEPTELQAMIDELASQIVSDTVSDDHQREVEQSDSFDLVLWERLASAELLGVGLPEELGGLGGGMLELATLLRQLGRAVASV